MTSAQRAVVADIRNSMAVIRDVSESGGCVYVRIHPRILLIVQPDGRKDTTWDKE